MHLTASSDRRPARSWPRRHPVATSVLIVAAAIFGLMVAFPGDESRGPLFLGILVFAIPIVIVVLLVTWLLDRRAARSAAAADDEPAAFASPVWPPAAPPMTPRDASSLWRSKPVDHAPSPGSAAPPDEVPPAAPIYPPSEPPGGPDPLRPITLAEILEKSPTEFEQLCVRVLLDLGYVDLRRPDDVGDSSAAVVGKDRQGRPVIVQCLRYEGDSVGSPTIQTFIGMQSDHKVDHKTDRGIVMTTAEFSRPAIQLALEHDIILFDGDDMVTLLNLTGSP